MHISSPSDSNQWDNYWYPHQELFTCKLHHHLLLKNPEVLIQIKYWCLGILELFLTVEDSWLTYQSSRMAKIASYFTAVLDHQLTEIFVPLSLNIEVAL